MAKPIPGQKYEFDCPYEECEYPNVYIYTPARLPFRGNIYVTKGGSKLSFKGKTNIPDDDDWITIECQNPDPDCPTHYIKFRIPDD